MDKHARMVAYINSTALSREDLSTMRLRAQEAIDGGDRGAQMVLDAVNRTAPSDRYFVFMGFCPGADFSNRLDIEWKSNSTCTFEFYESERQMKRFRSIQVGDLIILKKIQKRGKVMRLYGHGRVTALDKSEKGDRMLRMQWSPQSDEIEVQLLGCNDTVNIRDLEKVEGAMPDEFWKWLEP
ncbi:hypothetical protein [Aestuariivirga sp.]|jgi:hypothetical protein|uniref:hypothetical protein n=1 Tax=Aestuariivirga sp. TaxID=2650926 RepID=UPI003782D4B6